MADVPGLPVTRSLTLIQQSAVPDTYPGELTVYADSSGALHAKNGSGTDIVLGGGGGGGITQLTGDVLAGPGTGSVPATVVAVHAPTGGAGVTFGGPSTGFNQNSIPYQVELYQNGTLTWYWAPGGAVTAVGPIVIGGAITSYQAIQSNYAFWLQPLATPPTAGLLGQIYTDAAGQLHYVSTTGAGGTDYTLTPPTGGVTGTGVTNKVAYWSGTSSLTNNVGFDFHLGSGGTYRLSVGQTPDNTSATTTGYVETNRLQVNNVGDTTHTVGIVAATTPTQSYTVQMPPAGPTATNQVIVASTTGTVATTAWGSVPAPTGTAGSVAYFNPSGGALTSDSSLLYDGAGSFQAPTISATAALFAQGSFASSGQFSFHADSATGSIYNVASNDTVLEGNGVAQTMNLPALTSVSPGHLLKFVATTGALTITPNGSDIFANTGNNTPIVVAAGQALELVANGGQTAWDITGALGYGSSGGTAGAWAAFVSKTTSYTVVTGDNNTLFDDTGSSAQITFTLPSAPTKGFTVGFVTTHLSTGIKVVTSGSDHLLYPANTLLTFTTATSGSGHTGLGQTIVFTYMGGNLWACTGGYVYDYAFT